MTRAGTQKLGVWAMLAALFALLFSPLSVSACASLAVFASSTTSHSHENALHCHESSGETHHCAAKSAVAHCKYSNETLPEDSSRCCCAHDKNPFNFATAPALYPVQILIDRVEQPLVLKPLVVVSPLQWVYANSPPLRFDSSVLSSRAPPRFAK